MVDAAQVTVDVPTAALDARVFGVDLGSQRCVVAVDSGDVVLNELGGMTTATLVSFKGDERLIGEAAVLSSSTNPQNTIDFLNLLVGKDLAAVQARNDKVPGQRATFAQAEDHSHGSGAVAVVDYFKEKQQFSMEQLLGMLLGKLHEQMEKKLGASKEVVHVNLAVPSGWTEAEKRALVTAAKIAGIPSTTVITRAAALARCYQRKHPLAAPTEEGAEQPVKHIVIIDMGHTSTSVAVVKLTPEGETVLAGACDTALGSENFDLHLYEHFKAEIHEKHQIAINHHGKEGKRLLQSCEKLKKLLSTIGEATVTVENIAQDRDYTLKTTRDVFERLCAGETQRIHDLLTKVLADANVEGDAIASVEIVGGGTRIPFVQNAILSVFPSRDVSLIGRMLDSTTAVAVGAAFVGAATEELMLTPEETSVVDTLIAKEQEMKTRDTDIAAIAHERNAIEAFVYEMRSKQDTKHSEKINFSVLNPLLDDAEDWIYSEESEDATLESIRAKHQEIRSGIETACSAYFAAVEQDEKALEAQLEEESRRAEAERAAEGGGDDHDNRKLKKPERMRLVAKNKEEGNELFRDGNFQHAAMRYVKALTHASKFFDLSEQDVEEVNKLKLSLYLNLAQCYLKMEQWTKAIANCRDALDIDPTNAKALYRRAMAYEKEKKIEEAAKDVEAALKIAPEDKAIRKLDERLKVLIKRQLDKEKKMWSRAFA
ncbi:hypothetical protein Poli38472_008893 [Pythium oligandrum]|uniref:Heat shock protein 70 n=1 Tax=Pythium oligandrum TaxID=41045 RepID=A0A8K1C4F3_PYTOL|nr:hypothetical protein Poli38472_008893 [Pythium oligandrum]|eukprot:TMW56245.1 hypothetical protein Poli38472_008893 [Pythium oligandrum]